MSYLQLMTEPHHTTNDYNDEDDGDDKPVRVPIVQQETHARLVTGLRRAVLKESVLY